MCKAISTLSTITWHNNVNKQWFYVIYIQTLWHVWIHVKQSQGCHDDKHKGMLGGGCYAFLACIESIFVDLRDNLLQIVSVTIFQLQYPRPCVTHESACAAVFTCHSNFGLMSCNNVAFIMFNNEYKHDLTMYNLLRKREILRGKPRLLLPINFFFSHFGKGSRRKWNPRDRSAKELIKYSLGFLVLVVTVSLSHSCRSVAVLSIEIKPESCSGHTLSWSNQ